MYGFQNKRCINDIETQCAYYNPGKIDIILQSIVIIFSVGIYVYVYTYSFGPSLKRPTCLDTEELWYHEKVYL